MFLRVAFAAFLAAGGVAVGIRAYTLSHRLRLGSEKSLSKKAVASALYGFCACLSFIGLIVGGSVRDLSHQWTVSATLEAATLGAAVGLIVAAYSLWQLSSW